MQPYQHNNISSNNTSSNNNGSFAKQHKKETNPTPTTYEEADYGVPNTAPMQKDNNKENIKRMESKFKAELTALQKEMKTNMQTLKEDMEKYVDKSLTEMISESRKMMKETMKEETSAIKSMFALVMEEMRGMNQMAKPPDPQTTSQENKSSPVTNAITPDHQDPASGITGKSRYQ
eukprot:14589125-Ditylum_brightwellii.AAC.1